MPSRAPVGLETAQDRLERLNNPVIQQSTNLEIPKWAVVDVEEAPEIPSEPQRAPVEAEEIPSWAIPDSEEEEVPSWAISDDSTSDLDVQMSQFIDDDGLVGLPVGVDAYSYSQNDMSEFFVFMINYISLILSIVIIIIIILILSFWVISIKIGIAAAY